MKTLLLTVVIAGGVACGYPCPAYDAGPAEPANAFSANPLQDFFCSQPCAAIACDCAPPVMLEVFDANTRQLITDARLPEFENACSGGSCSVFGGAGEYRLLVTAPGYVSQTVVLSVPAVASTGSCCECGYQTQQRSVHLEPAQ